MFEQHEHPTCCQNKRQRSSCKLLLLLILGSIISARAFCPGLSSSRPSTGCTRLSYKKSGSGFSSRKDWDEHYEDEFEVKRNKVSGFVGFGGSKKGETSRQLRRKQTYADQRKPEKQKGKEKKSGGNWAKERDQRAGREDVSQVKIGADKYQQQRLAKVLAHAGVASRRVAETFIADGRVRVNGKMITSPGTVVDPRRDVIHLDGKRIALRTEQEIKWVMLNKPKGVLTTLEDEKGRKCVADLVPRARSLHMVPVGRLDRDSCGLLLLTNDLSFVHILTHPSYEHWKTYRVVITGQLETQDWASFEKGLMLKGETRKTAPCYLEPVKYDDGKKMTTVDVSIREGRNRQIRRMFDHLGHEVKSLKRTAFADLKLGSLAEGDFRELKKLEVEKLRELSKSKPGKTQQPVQNGIKELKEKPKKQKIKSNFPGSFSSSSVDLYSKTNEPDKQKRMLSIAD